MPKYSRRHYIDLGYGLRNTGAGEATIAQIAEIFAKDNPRFNETRWRRFIQTGKDTRK